MRRTVVAAAGLLLMLAPAACGVGSKPSAGSSATAPRSAAAGSTGTGTAGTGTGAGAATGTTTSSSSTTAAATSSGRAAHGRGKHGAGGRPAAPAGLSQTAGYATYERCQGTCTGAVPASLRRPLKLPAADGGPCPVTLHPQPASTGRASAGVGFRAVSGSQWAIAEATWTVPASYTGPLLIRGAMLGGGAIGFGTGAVPYDELQLLDGGKGAPGVEGGGRAWITYTRVRSGGCYAYQVDGTGFSEVVVFRAVT